MNLALSRESAIAAFNSDRSCFRNSGETFVSGLTRATSRQLLHFERSPCKHLTTRPCPDLLVANSAHLPPIDGAMVPIYKLRSGDPGLPFSRRRKANWLISCPPIHDVGVEPVGEVWREANEQDRHRHHVAHVYRTQRGLLDSDDRIALLGANGNGKTTFIKLLAGMLRPMAGEVVKSPRLLVGYFSQQLTEQLDPSASPIESLVRLRPHDTPERMRTYLGRFGFTNDMALGRIGSLSGGERARLVFAQIAASEPHVLLLDEPTNHLDIVSRDALVEAINEFDGAVVIVSHDPHLIALTVDRFWLVSGSRVASFEGDMADYRALTLERKSRPDELSRTETMPTPSRVTASKKQKRRESAERRREASSLANKVKKAEALVDRLTLEKQAILEKLADPALYRKQPEELKRLQQKIGWLQRDLDAAEAAWIAGQEKLEVRQKVASPNDTANRRPAGSS